MKKKNQTFRIKMEHSADKTHYRIQDYTVHSIFFGRNYALPEAYQQDNSVFKFSRETVLEYPTTNDVIDLRELLYDTIDRKIVQYPRYNACILWNPNGYLAATVSRYRMYRYRVYSHLTIWFGDCDETGIKGLWYTV